MLELSMLASFGYAGFHSSDRPYRNYLVGFGLPLVAAILWGIFMAPRSNYRLGSPYRSFLALMLFGISAFLLYRTGHMHLAIVFAGIALVSELTAVALKQ
ncbi:YrdB family protein [Spirosoma arboris]|uniref:YrdB family protein n=1 Tax=Spirosoma arboris TaxID=2682092 RepID=UPI001D115876|nr:YrdB family protein [Spirosoma arboris]